jgi:hypothetical protein
LQVLGLGGVLWPHTALPDYRKRSPLLGGPSSPSRIVLYVQPHGHLPSSWNMEIPGGASDQFAERSLVGLTQAELSQTLQPLYDFRDRLLVIEGLAHTAALVDIEDVTLAGHGDLNNHQVGVADVLTGSRALQQPGTYCTGGARSVDQELAVRLSTPGRFDSRVYGFDYIPNSVVSPFSYLGSGQATPMISDPAAAFSDLLGYLAPTNAQTSRQALLSSLRPSVLDAVSREYELLAPQLTPEGQQKLDRHRDLVRELEVSLGAIGPTATCNTTFDTTKATTSGAAVRQFMKLIQMAFACDLTRVVTFTAPVPPTPELGYPGNVDFHYYAHQSIQGMTACGQTYSPFAAQAMTDLDAWHAGHVNYLLQQLDSVAEGSGTLLDHTVVVWITELATPTHQHNDAYTLLAGGCNDFFKTGRYVRYPRILPNPMPGLPLLGPSHNRLLVTLMQAMGQADTSFGMTGAMAPDGTPLSFAGPLSELT